MLRSTTLLALSLCTAASALAAGTNHDLRPSHAKDQRVFVTLVNKGPVFRDVKIGDRNYTLMPDELLTVKAPAGTVVYANSSFGSYRRGDAYLTLSESLDHTRVNMR